MSALVNMNDNIVAKLGAIIPDPFDTPKIFTFLLIIVFFVATLLSLYHLGIEQGLIQESLVCDLQSGSTMLSKEEILKQLQQKSVNCKDVTFKIFGLSLTTFNMLISFLLTVFLTKMHFEYGKN